ncbi:MAG: NAD(P)/FAD-dependent oxidoreductase [Nevskia sp.]|nr:NAD(P)/FAD-dependent oxidoreductase [Nevskia sp.]
MLHRLRQLGLTARVFEAGEDIGGTWYWNSYPGARCDVESLDYSYSFSDALQQEWTWSERFATQPEILRYIHFVADRLNLRPQVSLRTRVTAAAYDEVARRWRVETDRGEAVMARFCIMATGCLTAAAVVPEIPGLGDFKGRWLHTGNWPKQPVDLAGRRVGVIGTGSSGIQVIPAIAPEVAQLCVFQRTPSFSVPARNAPLDPARMAELKAGYAQRRAANLQSAAGYVYDPNFQSALEVDDAQRQAEYEARWRKGGAGFLVAYKDLLLNQAANDTAAGFVRAKIRAIVQDPVTAEALVPRGFPMGARRLCLDSDYYASFNRANVKLVDLLKSPIDRIVPEGIRTADATYALDVIVFATGFDAMTGPLLRIDIRGRGGLPLRRKWARGPLTYLGLQVAGFPNLFIVAGPGSPSVLSNMVVSIEQHVDWIAQCLHYLQRNALASIEAAADSEAAWVRHVNEVAGRTLYPLASSWYTGANVAGKPRVFTPYLGGVHKYRERCEQVAAQGYKGFVLQR